MTGSQLRALLRDQHLPVVWLAHTLRLSRSQVHDRLSGRRGQGGRTGPRPTPPCPHGLMRAAHILGVEVSAIAHAVGGTDLDVAVGDSPITPVGPAELVIRGLPADPTATVLS